MVRHAALAALIATAGLYASSVAYAAPMKPLLILFTPNITADVASEKARESALTLRTQNASVSLRDQFNDSGYVDVVIYAPDNALFERAMLEAKIKPVDPNIPTAEERFAIAKAVGAAYAGYVSTYTPPVETPGGIDVELVTEQVEGRKTWKSRHNMGGSGGILSGNNFSNAMVSATNSLVQDFLNGPLHDLSQSTAPSLAPQPIPVVKSTTKPDDTSDPAALTNPAATPTAPSLAAPVPMTAGTTKVAPVKPNEPLSSSGADTDGAAEAEKRQGDESLRAGDTDAAILSFRKAISLAPRNATYRAALAQAYLDSGRKSDALSEAKRALNVIPSEDAKNRVVVSRLLASILAQNGDTTAARATYEDVIKNQSSAAWARVGLADLLAGQGQTAEAEAQYKIALKMTPDDKDAHLGYAKLLAGKGEYDAALNELTAATGSDDKEARYNTAIDLFDDGVQQIVTRVEQNRVAWQNKQLSQEVYYKATSAQTAKVSGLVSLLKAVPPPASGGEAAKQKHSKRIYAASMLLQAVGSLLTQVESNDADAGNQATVYLNEFKSAMRDVNSVRRASNQ